MKTHTYRILFFLLVISILIGIGCDGDKTNSSNLAELKIDLEPMKSKLDKKYDPSECTSPKPNDIGCTTICKHCITFICVDGEWQRYEVHGPSDEICQNTPPNTGNPSACPRDENGFCPAECSMCY